ncbi:MAG TPA: mechanosensitive ion channel family protein [Candidatus Bathyarchaeia archaeon]|nr:mechanosensitive ion channel family protein [Candidatus Bathyarchaeia archaeon]
MIPDIGIYGDVTLLDILRIIVILAVAVVIAKSLTINLKRGFRDKVSKDQLEIMTKVVYYGIIIIAVLAVLPTLGINPSGLLVAGGIAGIVIGIASQSVVSNLISGLFLIIERPMKIGQAVNIAGIAGVVEDIRIISTTLRTFEGLYVRIPNEKVFTTNITNYVEYVARRLEYIVGIRYSDDADKAIGIINNLHEKHLLTLKNPTPDIFVDNLGDNAVNIIVRIWVPTTEWYGVKKELLWKIKTALEDEGIEIAFPQRTVWFANELRKQEIENSEFAESGNQ